MRQSLNRPLLRTRFGRSLFPRSSFGHSADATVPVADRGSPRANFVPATVSATALPLNVSAALRSVCYDCVLFLELNPCSGDTDHSRITWTQVGVGERYFCRFHIYRDSASATKRRQLAADQPGPGQRYSPPGFD